MNRTIKRVFSLIMAVMIAFSFCITAHSEVNTEKNITILFTHDLHSHILPSVDEHGNEYGGYARLMTAIKEQKSKYPDAILVDGGDFSMGSLFQTGYTTSAIELRMMGAMGYDATTFGNHEFDYLPQGLASMLNVAADCGEKVPAIVNSNYFPSAKENSSYVWKAFENYGVKDYIILERGGIYYAIFGIFGEGADKCAPNSGMVLSNPADKAQQIVDNATAFCVENYGVEPVVVCLSHSGTDNKKGEDYELAKDVDGIHVIVSGHTHTTLTQPISVNGTYIVSAGEYGKNLGVVQLKYKSDGTVELADYKLIPINKGIAEDKKIAKLIKEYKAKVEEDYLSKYNMTFDKVLATNKYEFDSVDDLYASHHESTLGNLIADAYKWSVEKTTGEKVDIAVTATGVIRESLPVGNITVSDVFNCASLGVGTEGELVSVYVTGKDLKNILEVDASVQPLMSSAQLYFSGVEYSLNRYRMIFNKVDYSALRKDNGTLKKINDKNLYRIVTGMYCGQMLGTVKETSLGLISVTPRDKDGNPIRISDLKNYVVKDENGTPLKEWYAISSYLLNMNGQVSEKYAKPDGRKVVYSSLNPIRLLSNANVFTYVALGVLFLLILIVTLTIRFTVRRIRRLIRKRKKKELKDNETKNQT